MVVISYLNVASVTLGEWATVAGVAFGFLLAIGRYARKIKKGILYQIEQTRKNKEEIERIQKFGSKPMKEILSKLDVLIEENGKDG